MSQALYDIASKSIAQEVRLDMLANNLANVNSVGFKKDMLAVQKSMDGGDDRGGSDGSAPSSESFPYVSFTSFSSGSLRPTQNPLDCALEGTGFFCVKTEEGTEYTRNGVFSLNRDHFLVTQDGLPVLGEKGPVQVGDGEVVIDEQGVVRVDGTMADTLKVVDFKEPHRLRKTTDARFTAGSGTGMEELKAETTVVRQGFVESSNVNPVRVMTEMIEVLRGYESYQKVMQFMNDTTMKTINEVGRLK